MASISVMTLNLWNVNEPFGSRMRAFDDYIRLERPDIVCLQEVPVVGGHAYFPEAMSILGYHRIYLPSGEHRDRQEGIAICTLEAAALVGALPLPGSLDDSPRSALAVKMRVNSGKSVLVVTTHLSYRPTHRELRCEQACEIGRMVRRLWSNFGRCPTIVAGDFNCTDDEDTLQVLQNMDGEGQLRDVQFEFGQAHKFTFARCNPYVSPELWPDRRIDYILASEEIVLGSFRLVLNDVSAGGLASDHFGLALRADLVQPAVGRASESKAGFDSGASRV